MVVVLASGFCRPMLPRRSSRLFRLLAAPPPPSCECTEVTAARQSSVATITEALEEAERERSKLFRKLFRPVSNPDLNLLKLTTKPAPKNANLNDWFVMVEASSERPDLPSLTFAYFFLVFGRRSKFRVLRKNYICNSPETKKNAN